MGELLLIAPWVGLGHCDLHSPDTCGNDCADLEELEADRTTGGMGELGEPEADPAQRTQKDIGHGGESQAQLVGTHDGGRCTVREQVGLALLDPVLHLAAGAVDLLVEMARFAFSLPQRCHHEPRIGAAFPVRSLSSIASASSVSISATGRWFLARPNRKSTLFPSHQRISSSRQKPLSGRSKMRVRGQWLQICVIIRSISSHAPAAPSMFERRSLAASRCRPQKM